MWRGECVKARCTQVILPFGGHSYSYVCAIFAEMLFPRVLGPVLDAGLYWRMGWSQTS